MHRDRKWKTWDQKDQKNIQIQIRSSSGEWHERKTRLSIDTFYDRCSGKCIMTVIITLDGYMGKQFGMLLSQNSSAMAILNTLEQTHTERLHGPFLHSLSRIGTSSTARATLNRFTDRSLLVGTWHDASQVNLLRKQIRNVHRHLIDLGRIIYWLM